MLKDLAFVGVLFLTIFGSSYLVIAQERFLVVTPGIAPISYEQDGKVTGIGAELVTEAFHRMGYLIDIKIFPGARALLMLQQGEADALFALAKTQEREDFAVYSVEPIIDQPISLFVRRDSTFVFDGDLKKLKPYHIGVVRGGRFSPDFEGAMKYGFFPHLEQANDYRQNVMKLVKQRIDILIGSRISVLYAAKEDGLENALKELKPPLTVSSPAYLAFSKKGKAVELVTQFDEVLKTMRHDGTYDRVTADYNE